MRLNAIINKEENAWEVSARVPDAARPLVTGLCHAHAFGLRISRPRRTKLGDFTFSPEGHFITLNSNLSPALFLITFLHEVAHLRAVLERKRREAPHGSRWKRHFSALLVEAALQHGMDPALSQAMVLHARNPTATLQADPAFCQALSLDLDQKAESMGTLLGGLKSGDCFIYKGKQFIKSGMLSRRHYASDLESGRLYSFSAACRVRPLDEVPAVSHQLQLGESLKPGQMFMFRGREFRLESHRRRKMFCTDIETGRLIDLHGLMHVELHGTRS